MNRQTHPALVSLFFVLPLITGIVVWITPYFVTNDDTWIMLRVAGKVTSTSPAEDVIFINILLSRFLAYLYSISQDVPWYACMHIGSIAAAMWATLYALSISTGSFLRFSLFFPCLAGFAGPFIIGLQFTQTSFLLGQGALFLLFASLSLDFAERQPVRLTVIRITAVAFLLSLSLAMRGPSLYLVLALGSPALLLLAVKAWRTKRIRAFLLVCIALGALLTAIQSYHPSRYHSDDAEWRRYFELHAKAALFIDFKAVRYDDTTKRYFDGIGWTRNDYDMIVNHFYVDRETYSLENLKEITDRLPLVEMESFSDQFGHALVRLFHRMRRDPLVWIVAIMSLGIGLIGLRREALVAYAVTIAITFSTLCILAAFLKLPAYVYQPAIMFLCWSALLLGTGGIPSRYLKWCGVTFVATAVLLAAGLDDSPLRQAVVNSENTTRANHALRESLSRLRPTRSQTFFTWAEQFPYEFILPLERKEYLLNFRAIGIGAANQSPIQRQKLALHGIPDLHSALFKREDVFISASPASRSATILERYIQQHYGEEVEVTKYFDDGLLSFSRVVKKK